jgi:hypothetical protein
MIYKKVLVKRILLGLAAGICVPFIGYSQNPDISDTSGIRRDKATLVPLKTEPPQVSKKVVEVTDQFLITLKSDSISVTHKKKILPIYSAKQLDDYLNKNLANIDQAKICICNNSTTPHRFNEVLAVLKKYRIYHFSFYSNK